MLLLKNRSIYNFISFGQNNKEKTSGLNYLVSHFNKIMKITWKQIFIIFFIIVILLLAADFGYKKYSKIQEEKRIELLRIENEKIKIAKEKRERESLLKKRLEEERMEREKKEAEEKLAKERAELKVLEKERAKRNISIYKKGHKIFLEKKYVPINISSDYQRYFSIAEVVQGDNYWTILERVFGKSEWAKFSSSEKNKFVSVAEKISRVGRYSLKKGMKVVLPNSKKAFSFSPFSEKLSDSYIAEIAGKRDEKIGQYWNDFGSVYGNNIFQIRAGKKSEHILIINRKTQYFGMYKNGVLKNWGPISSGKVGHKTPAGFYVSLWFKDMWHSITYGDAEMPNAVNYDPDGFFTHAGKLPGYPQSHGCPRVLKGDSEKIFGVAKSEVFPIIVL